MWWDFCWYATGELELLDKIPVLSGPEEKFIEEIMIYIIMPVITSSDKNFWVKYIFKNVFSNLMYS